MFNVNNKVNGWAFCHTDLNKLSFFIIFYLQFCLKVFLTSRHSAVFIANFVHKAGGSFTRQTCMIWCMTYILKYLKSYDFNVYDNFSPAGPVGSKVLNILGIFGSSREWNYVFLWEESNLLKKEIWWNKTDKADWQGMIDNKDDIDPVLCQNML